MKRTPTTTILGAVAMLLVWMAASIAYVDQPISPRAQERLEREVQEELAMLPYYGVFDFLSFRVAGDRVELRGQVTHPTLKSDAEQAVRKVEGVGKVMNSIEVLPLSPNDDRIRLAVSRAIYSADSPLFRYTLQPVPPIHIIVKGGHVTLEGVVADRMEKTFANLRAREASGVFSVTDNLQVEGNT